MTEYCPFHFYAGFAAKQAAGNADIFRLHPLYVRYILFFYNKNGCFPEEATIHYAISISV